MSWVTPFGLFLDIVGAGIITISDLPNARKGFAKYCPRTKQLETTRRWMLNHDLRDKRIILEERVGDYETLHQVLEKEVGRTLPTDKFTATFSVDLEGYGGINLEREDGKSLRYPTIGSFTMSKRIQEWYSIYFRRLGLGFLILGFTLQLFGSL